MHQDSKSSRQLSISSVGTKHILTLLLSLSEKLLGSNGTSRDSEGCQTKGPSSLEIWICLEPLQVTVSGPSLRLPMLGKDDMSVLLCLLVCLAFAERASLSYSPFQTPQIFNRHSFSNTPGLVSNFFVKKPIRLQGP